VPEESTAVVEGASKKEFSIARKGYDPAEVDEYLAEYDAAFRDLEDYAARLKQELAEVRLQVGRLEAAEKESVDRAMLVVFDAKERIIERAKERAQEIVNEACAAAGIAPVTDGSAVADLIDDDLDELAGVASPVAQPLGSADTDKPSAIPVAAVATSDPEPTATKSSDSPEAAAVLQQMLKEASTIRSQLEEGLTSAFSEIERMQRHAELRANAFLDDARAEAEEIRQAGEKRTERDPGHGEAKIEVTLASEEQPDASQGERASRYSRNSAKLPRIGESAGESVLASMNQLRNKLREVEEVAQQVQEPSAS
jgi:cell division septum initiation protein DivIVA